MEERKLLHLDLQNGNAEQIPEKYKEAIIKVTRLIHLKGTQELTRLLRETETE